MSLFVGAMVAGGAYLLIRAARAEGGAPIVDAAGATVPDPIATDGSTGTAPVNPKPEEPTPIPPNDAPAGKPALAVVGVSSGGALTASAPSGSTSGTPTAVSYVYVPSTPTSGGTRTQEIDQIMRTAAEGTRLLY